MKRKPRIVLVEDEEILSNLIALKLEDAGYDVASARDGREGLGLITQTKPDLVLLDIMLPTLNGFDILEELNRQHLLPALPVVIISNSGQPVEIERAKKLGVRDYLIKLNFSPQEVLEKVKLVLEGDADDPLPFTNKETGAEAPTAHILIVEDDVMLCEFLKKKFSEKRYRASVALNADEARRILKDEAVDLVLLDIVLPDTDGFAFLGELKAAANLKNIPVIIISNLGQKDEIKRGLAAGAADYVVKANVLPGDILAKVEAVLRTR